MKKNIKISCAILAGGKSSRMNFHDKSFIKIESKPLIIRTLEFLNQIFNETIIVTNT